MPSGVGQMYAVIRACSEQDRQADDVRSQSGPQDAGRQVCYWQVTLEDSSTGLDWGHGWFQSLQSGCGCSGKQVQVPGLESAALVGLCSAQDRN